MSYLDKYDTVVMKKCLDTRVMKNFELNNLANGRLTKTHFGGYVARKPLSSKDLVLGLSNHGFNPKETLKGFDVDELLLELNQNGLQLEELLLTDDLESLYAQLPPEDFEERPEEVVGYSTPMPTWLRDAEQTLASTPIESDSKHNPVVKRKSTIGSLQNFFSRLKGGKNKVSPESSELDAYEQPRYEGPDPPSDSDDGTDTDENPNEQLTAEGLTNARQQMIDRKLEKELRRLEINMGSSSRELY